MARTDAIVLDAGIVDFMHAMRPLFENAVVDHEALMAEAKARAGGLTDRVLIS